MASLKLAMQMVDMMRNQRKNSEKLAELKKKKKQF